MSHESLYWQHYFTWVTLLAALCHISHSTGSTMSHESLYWQHYVTWVTLLAALCHMSHSTDSTISHESLYWQHYVIWVTLLAALCHMSHSTGSTMSHESLYWQHYITWGSTHITKKHLKSGHCPEGGGGSGLAQIAWSTFFYLGISQKRGGGCRADQIGKFWFLEFILP